jgi:hypothetical protein
MSTGSSPPGADPGEPRFTNIKTLVKVFWRVEYADRCRFETRFCLSSAPLHIDTLADGARGHWGVESMHWLLDVEFKDDLSRYRSGHGAKNMAIVRRFALGLVGANNVQAQRQNTQKISKLGHSLLARTAAAQLNVNRNPCRGALRAVLRPSRRWGRVGGGFAGARLAVATPTWFGEVREGEGHSGAGFAPRNALMPPRRFLPSRRRILEANVGRVGRRGLGRRVAARISSISRVSASSRLRS